MHTSLIKRAHPFQLALSFLLAPLRCLSASMLLSILRSRSSAFYEQQRTLTYTCTFKCVCMYVCMHLRQLLLTFIVVIDGYSDAYDFCNCAYKWITGWRNIININFYIDNKCSAA